MWKKRKTGGGGGCLLPVPVIRGKKTENLFLAPKSENNQKGTPHVKTGNRCQKWEEPKKKRGGGGPAEDVSYLSRLEEKRELAKKCLR
jgi:hypothetical protein